jgi:hypothetical protein
MSSSTGNVSINNSWGTLQLTYGTPANHGFDITANAHVPTGFTGSFQFLQIANSWLRRIRFKNGDWYRNAGTKLLDTSAIYPSYNDSPGMELISTFDKAEASDSFESYLMFKPSGASSIWVPLRVIKNLSWSGKATRTGAATWTLDSSNNNNNPTSLDATDFPEWNGNILNLKWIKE